MNTQKSGVLIIGFILIILIILLNMDFLGLSSSLIPGKNKDIPGFNTLSGEFLENKKFICPYSKNLKNEVVYDSCIKRFSDFDLTDKGSLRTLYTKAGNPFIYDIYTHIYTYIIGSLLMDDFFIGESDSFGEKKFLGFAFYQKYYSVKNPENQKEALGLLNTIKNAYLQGKTIETKHAFIEIFYNGYITSTYYPKRDYIKYFNSVVGDCAKTGNCKSLQSTLFTEQLVFFFFYINNLETKFPNNICEDFTCAYLQKRFYE